ncbi:hypothetical protein GCM10028803_45980 [Larkinella knui]|uniref:T9SS C-terminal target domain-containing protein n=1 Tax=Larkinella knui TaxID=2025310 RepID=A0A3P1CPF4_9BACT|nr:hypothetical protein [Larkinella knui]RRB15197.1 hypothetical protein EHT87_11680 [Larkinella knui]
MKTNFVNNNVKLGLAMLAATTLVAIAPSSAEARVLDGPKAETKATPVSIREVGNLKFKVTVNQPVNDKIVVSIVDDSNNKLYNGTLTKTEQLGRVFDFSQLADGKYVIEVAYGKEKVSQSFAIQTQVSRVVLARN